MSWGVFTIDASPSAADALRENCWRRAVHTYGTAAIFERRARQYRRRVRLLTFLGIAVPAAVGGIVLSFGTKPTVLPWIIAVACILGTMQLVATIWSVVAEWNSSFAYAQESAAENRRLASNFERLGSNPPPDLATRFEVLDAQNHARSDNDVKQGVSTKELHFGLRSGLHRFRRKCEGCGVIPDPLAPTDCAVCGTKRRNWKLWRSKA